VEQKGVSFLKFYTPKFSSLDVATGIIFGSHTGIFARKHLKRKMKKGHGTPKFDSKSKSSHFKKIRAVFLREV
jgi:hypothetical protein